MANRKRKELPDIGAKVRDLFYQIQHATTPLGIKEIELIIRHVATSWPKQSPERKMFVREMQDKLYQYYITNHNS